MKLLYLDTETTGTDPQKHGIIQISGIIEINGELIEEFDYRCKPFENKIFEAKALEVNGVTVEQIKSYPDPQAVYRELLIKLNKYVDKYNKLDKFYLVGQNVKFDYEFIKQFFIDNGNNFYYAYFMYHLIDLIAITALFKVAGKINPKNMKLQTIADLFNIEFKAHDSMEDIRVTRKLFHIFKNLL